jgi:hypothetical protein
MLPSACPETGYQNRLAKSGAGGDEDANASGPRSPSSTSTCNAQLTSNAELSVTTLGSCSSRLGAWCAGDSCNKSRQIHHTIQTTPDIQNPRKPITGVRHRLQARHRKNFTGLSQGEKVVTTSSAHCQPSHRHTLCTGGLQTLASRAWSSRIASRLAMESTDQPRALILANNSAGSTGLVM